MHVCITPVQRHSRYTLGRNHGSTRIFQLPRSIEPHCPRASRVLATGLLFVIPVVNKRVTYACNLDDSNVEYCTLWALDHLHRVSLIIFRPIVFVSTVLYSSFIPLIYTLWSSYIYISYTSLSRIVARVTWPSTHPRYLLPLFSTQRLDT